MTPLPVFSSTYSIGDGNLLTLEEPGKAKAGGPVSVFDLAREAGLKEVVLVDTRMDGVIQAYRIATKLGVKLCFGLKLCVCADATDKSDASLKTESNVVVIVREGAPNAQHIPYGYSDLVRVWSRASTEGYYYRARTSYAWLTEQWTPNLLLALPWASSFIARNTLTFNTIVPSLPAAPWVFREVATELPFARLIDGAIARYVEGNPEARVIETKSVLYRTREDFRPYVVMRAIANRSSFARPKVDHLSSPAFSWEDWKRLCPTPTPSPSPTATASP